MCGIAGVFNRHRDEAVPEALLDRMVDGLAHRGPDDRGGVILGSVALGMRRLAIIDVEGGHQPMSTADGAVHLVYNGETYNHLELRRSLEERGHRFRTRCDTEVLLLGYRQWGIRGLAERLNGIFAFALWDEERRTGYLVRDRLGVKPLYYVDRNGRFVFASELRALMQSGLLRARIDDVALWGYLTYQFSPDERTLVAGARKLPPAHILEWRDGGVSLAKYWDFPAGGEIGGDFSQHAGEVRALLLDAVERQMMSDVPIGCFLSGGLDSTFIAAAMSRRAGAPIRTYSIAFPDAPEVDESAHFESVARTLGCRHQTIPFCERDVLDHLDRFAWAADEPVADPAMLPTYLLAQAAARDVKVVLTGEGADEVFAGYPYYRDLTFPALAARTPSEVLAARWKRSTSELGRRLRVLFPAPRNDRSSPVSGFPYALDADFLWHLLAPRRRPELARLESLPARAEARALAGLEGSSRLQAALVVDTKLWLANDLMPKLDKMTMAHSLEGRVPFLDHRLVELAFKLPTAEKVGREHGKLVLREAARGIVPEPIVGRRKQGFNVPLGEWFRGPLYDFLRETLLGSRFTELELFERRALEALIVAHRELSIDVARPLWQVLCLGLWMQRLQASMAPLDPVTTPLEIRSRRLGQSLAPAPSREPVRCDIVIPVFGGVNYVRDLLRSIERSTAPGSYQVYLVDDSASDETHEALGALARGRPWVSLHRNPENVGFLASSNRGVALGSAPYVCLLNSDTLVGEGWLDRLIAAAESDDSVAVVNPVSNKAVNLSVPMPPGYDLNSLNRKLAQVGRRGYPEVTTAVGFCMLLERRFVDWLGDFDPVYGHGYCEESDLCMRYTEAGLKVVVAEDTFVYHKGCGSFGTWLERYRKNRPIFDARWYDEFQRDYNRFLKRNPLQPLRDLLLRHTLSKYQWSAVLSQALDTQLARHRLRRAARLATRPVRAMRGLWTAAGTASRRAASWVKAAARPRTALDPEQRAVRYPTRTYIESIPASEDLRVTFLVADMPVCGGILSIAQLARELILQGLDVRIATLFEELEPERFNLPAQPLIYPDHDTLLRLLPPSDVVVATFWTTAHDYLAELRRRYDFLSVYFIQDYEAYFYPEAERETRRQVAATYSLAERRIVKSEWLRSLIAQRHGLDCEIVPLGLDLGIFRPRQRRPANPARPRVISVARPRDRRRGFAEVAEAFRRIHRRRPDVELVYFGTASEDMPADLGFPYENRGNVGDQNEVAALIASCDVLVDPSLFQAFGRPGLEAMACGVSCVLTSEGGVREYARHEENCLMVPPGDAEALAAATLRLLGDPGLRDALREPGLRTAARFSHVAEARRHLELYRGWIAERSSGSARPSSVAARPTAR